MKKLPFATGLIILLACGGGAAGAQQATVGAAPPPVAQTAAQLSATNTAVPTQLNFDQTGGWFHFWQRFQPAEIGNPDLTNTAGLERRAAAGTMYLSLHEVLQLALSADLDIADAAYAQLLARPDYLRTLAGGSARGVAGEVISSALFSGAIGASGNGGSSGSGTNAGSVGGGGSGVHGGGGGYDPSFTFSYADEHSRTPLLNPVLYGTSEQILNQSSGGASFGQSFTTGFGYTLSGGSGRQYQNSDELFYNPVVSSDLSIGVQQQLLSGGSRKANLAPIIIGRNGLQFADAVFKAKVIDIVSQAATQYWALAAADQQVEIAEEAEQHASDTLADTQAMVDQGKTAQADLITAQATLSTATQARQQAEVDARIAVSKLKLFLAKQWSPEVAAARIVANDPLPQPVEAGLPEADQLVARAINASPVLTEDRVNLDNDQLTVVVRKNSLLPSLTVYASYTSSGVSGLGANCAISAFPCPAGYVLAPLPGGFGKSLSNIFSYQAPDYGVGFSLNVPVFNRVNRADEATAELQVAQQKVDLQKDTNVVTEQVTEDRIQLEGQVAQLRTARQGEAQQRQAVANMEDKYKLGKSTIADVIAAQGALATAQKAVMTAEAAYATAQVALAKDSGTLLEDYHVVLKK